MTQNFDAIVIGAGYIGCSAAYHLCSAGFKTALFDRGGIAAGASAANYGNIQIQDMELEKSVELTLLGRAFHAALEEELGCKIGLRKIGGLLPIENETQWEIMRQRREKLNRVGIRSELIPSERLPEVEPYLNSKNLLGALYHPDEGQVDPFQLIWGYVRRARQMGLREYLYIEVTGLEIKNNRVCGVKTPNGNFGAKNVVVCTGAFTRRIGQTIGRNWDVRYALGQAAVTERVGFILRNHIASASFFEAGGELKKGEILANLAISQSTHGNMLIGEAMYAADHFRTHVPAASVPAIAARWARYFPALAKLRVLRSWSAPVADTGDGLPLLGPVSGLDGLYVAAAFRSTVIVTPLAGKTIAQLAATGKSDLEIKDFSPDRISPGR